MIRTHFNNGMCSAIPSKAPDADTLRWQQAGERNNFDPLKSLTDYLLGEKNDRSHL